MRQQQKVFLSLLHCSLQEVKTHSYVAKLNRSQYH